MSQIQEKKTKSVKLSHPQVVHLSKNLSRLALSEGEYVKAEADLNNIVEYIDQLQNVDPSIIANLDVDVSRGVLQPRKDEILLPQTTPEELLKCAPQKVINHQIAIENIMHE